MAEDLATQNIENQTGPGRICGLSCHPSDCCTLPRTNLNKEVHVHCACTTCMPSYCIQRADVNAHRPGSSENSEPPFRDRLATLCASIRPKRGAHLSQRSALNTHGPGTTGLTQIVIVKQKNIANDKHVCLCYHDASLLCIVLSGAIHAKMHACMSFSGAFAKLDSPDLAAANWLPRL